MNGRIKIIAELIDLKLSLLYQLKQTDDKKKIKRINNVIKYLDKLLLTMFK